MCILSAASIQESNVAAIIRICECTAHKHTNTSIHKHKRINRLGDVRYDMCYIGWHFKLADVVNRWGGHITSMADKLDERIVGLQFSIGIACVFTSNVFVHVTSIHKHNTLQRVYHSVYILCAYIYPEWRRNGILKRFHHFRLKAFIIWLVWCACNFERRKTAITSLHTMLAYAHTHTQTRFTA